jgi:alanine or glycine:cation symporter, AGCS family
MAYYFIAEANLSYLTRNKSTKWAVKLLQLAILSATFYGSIKTAEVAWTLGDIGVGMMAWLNIIAILLLRKPAFKAFDDYKKQRKAGKDPVFIAKNIGLENTDLWK